MASAGVVRSLFDGAARAELLTRLEQVSPESPARWGNMSATDMAAHLNDTFRMASGELPTMRPPGRLIQLLRVPPINYLAACFLPFGRGMRTAPELIARQPERWEAEIRTLRSHLEDFGKCFATRPMVDHPFFGRLPRHVWGVLGYRHIAHHLRQFGA